MQTPLIIDKPAAATAAPPAPPIGSDRARDGNAHSRRHAANGSTGSPDLWVEPWVDLCTDAHRGHHPRSPYVELFWLGVLGPSATWLIRRLAMRLEEEPEGYAVNTAEIAGEIGLGSRQALQSAFDRAFDRCCRFGLMQRGRHNTLFVRYHRSHTKSHEFWHQIPWSERFSNVSSGGLVSDLSSFLTILLTYVPALRRASRAGSVPGGLLGTRDDERLSRLAVTSAAQCGAGMGRHSRS